MPEHRLNMGGLSGLVRGGGRSIVANGPGDPGQRGIVVALLTVALFLVGGTTLSGCASVDRRPAPMYWYRDAVPPGYPATVRTVKGDSDSEDASRNLLSAAMRAAGGGTVNVLALSGGGAGAAFGAGALAGWTRTGSRPDFQIVTGVSAGALLAPFAFLGAEWDSEMADAFSGKATAHLLRRQIVAAMLGASLYRGEPLVELVDRYVTDDLLRAIAARAALGRLLLVATTNLDSESTVIWNLGIIAQRGGPEARRLFRDILVASASIPGLFPPVVIRVEESGAQFDELHVDGGTTAPFVIVPGLAEGSPHGLHLLQGANVYVIVNGQLGVSTAVTPTVSTAIVKRGVEAILQSSARLTVALASAYATQDNLQLRIAQIPPTYQYGGPLDVRPASMKALFEFGESCATNGELWAAAAEALQAADEVRQVSTPSRTSCPAPAREFGAEPLRSASITGSD